MTYNKSKRGSSIRKGFEYQDLTALRLALELYIQRQEYQLFIEHDGTGSLDDIVIAQSDRVDAYQVKYAVSPNAVYALDNFTNPDSKVYLKKFSDSWVSLKQQYLSKGLTLHLLTNRALDAELSELITAEGFFLEEFIGDRKYKRPREIRKKLQEVTQLDEDDFQEFLCCFQFQIKQPNLDDLIQHIQADLLDHQLGLSDRSIYYDLKEIIEDFAINRHGALTTQFLDEFLRKTQSRYLLPQKFEVDKTLYVERDSLKTKLDVALQSVDGDYVIVTGLPGSGKSTSLTVYFDDREQSSDDPIARYYCFVDINDNFQKRRLKAQSLRVNLLSVLQDQFHDILSRHFDYSEDNFYQVLKTLGEHFTNNNRKLIIFIDGLDHAERMESEIQESVLKALPAHLPKGIVIVVGTQELHHWSLFLKKSRENPNAHIELPLFTLSQTREYLVEKKQLTGLSEEQIQEIHQKSEGLPLYLRYIAERISEVDDVTAELERIPLIPEGDIKNYYEMLWQEFESVGKGKVQHLCGVLACLRFPVHRGALFSFQKQISRPDFQDCFQLVQHLLKQRDGLVEIFHNSFREFVLPKLDSSWIQTIYADITDHLKSREGSNLWFSYVFEYACMAKDSDYVIDKVNREFVDYALSRYRSDRDVKNAIYWAAESAKEKSDVLALSRLGALKSRTQERIEQHLDRNILSKTLLAMGKEEDVVRYSYSLHQNQWLIDFTTALNLLKELPNQNKQEIGERLFAVFEESFHGTKLQDRSDLLNFAYCLGIYGNSLARALEWLSSQIELQPDILETLQPYVPDYAPHLEAYLDAIVRYQPEDCWIKTKSIESSFSNQLIRYLLIRSIARYKDRSILKEEIEEYISLFHPTSNPELAFYAALAGLPSEEVANLLGDVSLPPLDAPERFSRSDPSLHNYRMIFFALGYGGKKESIEQIRNHLQTKESWWTSYLLYLTQTGECVGKHWAQKQVDWFGLAIDSINTLSQIKQGERERVIELLDLCRDELVESLFWLTKAVEESYPDRLKEWFEKLKSLQDSKIWTMHYGIGESIRDYTFELRIYERLSSIPKCHMHIIELLRICEEKFKKSTLLKGGSRSDHFLRLALIAARCGFKSNAEEWLQYGIKSTLVYGYHKDIALFHLIDIMEMLNKHEPDLAIERCADILGMVDWMPHLTDGRETRYLPQDIFEEVVKVNTNAALRLLRIYAKNKARWQMQDCLETLIKQNQDGDPEILWALTSVFANHLSEDGKYPKQVVNAKQHIVEIVEKSGNLKLFETFKQRLDHFIRTNVTPRHWSKLTSKYWQLQHLALPEEDLQSGQDVYAESPQKMYKLEGEAVTIQEIKDQLSASFEDYKETIQKLKDENQSFYESALTDSVLKLHISQMFLSSDLLAIKDYLMSEGKWLNADLLRELGHRFMDLGDVENGLDCLELAYSNTMDWSRWKRNQHDFKVISEYDTQRAIKLLVSESYRFLTEYSGYDVPASVASAYDVLGDIQNLKRVYQDYLQHCQELFEQLPKRRAYKWLKDYPPEADDFDQLVVHFLVDELDTIEIDLGNRLIDAYRELCLARPEITLPIFVERLLNADELPKSRLLTILYMVVYDSPQLLIPYAEKISDLLNAKHFQWKMMTIKLLQFVAQSGSVSETVKERLRSAQHYYSPVINCSIFRLPHNNPSDKFLDFFTKNTMISNQDQIGSCCEILSIDKDAVLAKIEHILKEEGWSEEDENERLKDEWNGHVHPQGFPSVTIITTFNLRGFNLSNQIFDEIVEKSRLSTNQLEALWRILQPADPEYKLSSIKPKPKDIAPLVVSDKDVWLSELNSKQVKVAREALTQEWVTLFEQRILSQDKTYEVPYRLLSMLYSSLIISDLLFSFEELEQGSFYVLKLRAFHDNDCITLHQARELLTNHRNLISDYRDSFLPILTWKTNHPLFFGHHELVSLPSYLINQYGLTYRDFDLYKDGKCVMKYEEWQEGYQDECYSRELLSHGTRLMIHRSLLQKIFQDYDVELCQSIFEKRLYYRSKYDAKAAGANRSTAFMIIHD
jgi:hypothetical protein